MLTDNDEKIVGSVLDSLLVTAESLKELGWEHVSSTGSYYVYWTVWRYVNLYIEMFQDGRCFLKQHQNDSIGVRIDSVRELKTYM